MSRQILVYLDEGVSSNSFEQLFRALQSELASSYTIRAVDHRTLITANWEEETALLAIPGGRDLPYQAALEGTGNRRIATYVSQGGRYLGICAGGYYGSAYVEFEKGRELEVCGKRDLAFFPGRAVGPAYGLGRFSYESEEGAQKAHLTWGSRECHVYFNGGCYFDAPETHPATQVLARYHDLPGRPAAVIQCVVEKGRAVLSGTHPEYSVEPSLEPQRKAFWSHLLNKTLT